MFIFETSRLMRGMPWDQMKDPVDELVEEFLAMWAPDAPIFTQTPIQLVSNGQPMLQFQNVSQDQAVMSFENNGASYNLFFSPSQGITIGPRLAAATVE